MILSKIILEFIINVHKNIFSTTIMKTYLGFADIQRLNIFNEPLQACGTAGDTQPGSWDSEKKCTELDGGVHQICASLDQIPNFSSATGQSNWSSQMNEDHNHCLCLGAWSLYNAESKEEHKNALVCDAIPREAFSMEYVSKFSEGWNKWNGLEVDDQIVSGVNSLMENCYKPCKKRCGCRKHRRGIALKENYCTFAASVPALRASSLYSRICK